MLYAIALLMLLLAFVVHVKGSLKCTLTLSLDWPFLSMSNFRWVKNKLSKRDADILVLSALAITIGQVILNKLTLF